MQTDTVMLNGADFQGKGVAIRSSFSFQLPSGKWTQNWVIALGSLVTAGNHLGISGPRGRRHTQATCDPVLSLGPGPGQGSLGATPHLGVLRPRDQPAAPAPPTGKADKPPFWGDPR